MPRGAGHGQQAEHEAGGVCASSHTREGKIYVGRMQHNIKHNHG